jgi:hypothetical protein
MPFWYLHMHIQTEMNPKNQEITAPAAVRRPFEAQLRLLLVQVGGRRAGDGNSDAA